jgi:hypothetical protein
MDRIGICHFCCSNDSGNLQMDNEKITTIDPASTVVSIYVGSKFVKVAGENVETKIYLVDDKKKVSYRKIENTSKF